MTGVLSVSGSVCLPTGSDSPVRVDSSACSFAASIRRMSAVTMSPPSRMTISPGTSWLAAQVLHVSVAHNDGFYRSQATERLHRTDGPPLGQKSNRTVYQDDGEYRQPFYVIREKECEYPRRCQQPDDNAFELVSAYGQNAAAFRRFQLVFAKLALARLRFGGSQAEKGINLQICQRFGCAFSPGIIAADASLRFNHRQRLPPNTCQPL